MEQTDTIKVSSSEGFEYSIGKTAAEMSKLLKGAMQDFQGDILVPLQDINELTTKRVIEYLTKWNGEIPAEIEKPLRSGDMKENTDLWSANYIDALTLEEIADLAIAANFMEIQPLLDLTCAKIASIGKDKSEEELFKKYGITTPFTEEEKQKIKDENPWLEQSPEI